MAKKPVYKKRALNRKLRQVCVQLAHGGIFYNLTRYIAAMAWARHHSVSLLPRWPSEDSLYGGDYADGDVWDQYFKRIGHMHRDAYHCSIGVGGGSLKQYDQLHKQRYAYPEWYKAITCTDDASQVLEFVESNRGLRQLIQRTVLLKPYITEQIDDWYRGHMQGCHIVGAHVRGPGRLHDGAALLNWWCGYEEFPPYEAYFKAIDQQLKPDSKVLLGTDAGVVQTRFSQRYGDRLLITKPQQLELGEGHELAKSQGGDPAQQGVEALIDGYLLAACPVVVLGSSNMSNYIAALSTGTPIDIYAPARGVNFKTLPEPADVDIIKTWHAADPVASRIRGGSSARESA